MSEFAEIALASGARDVFVLAYIDGESAVNIGGHGRGEGWAGNIHVEPSTEPWLADTRKHGFARANSGVPMRLFGPYWATNAIGVSLDKHIVVFGGDGVAIDKAAAEKLADRAVAAVSEVPPSKRLADELEIAQAALEIATMRARTVDDVARGLATRVARALSCEFGAVLLFGDPMRVFLADEGWRPAASEEEIIAALLPLVPVVQNGLHVEQDLTDSAFAFRPLAIDDGLVSRCALPLGSGGEIGLVVAAHAASSPRGFTTLCQRVFQTAARTAEPILEDALAAGN